MWNRISIISGMTFNILQKKTLLTNKTEVKNAQSHIIPHGKPTLHTFLICGDDRHTHLFQLLLLFNVKLWRRYVDCMLLLLT